MEVARPCDSVELLLVVFDHTLCGLDSRRRSELSPTSFGLSKPPGTHHQFNAAVIFGVLWGLVGLIAMTVVPPRQLGFKQWKALLSKNAILLTRSRKSVLGIGGVGALLLQICVPVAFFSLM